ncbi:Fc.00g003890.m01.CDS01 [Cosmosporella sp. VM-42]
MSSHYGSSSSSSGSDSDLSSTSSSGYRHSMDSSQRPIVSIEVLRCMRCARSVEATSTDDISAMGMVRIAHNLYYCERCAKMVGYK